MAPQNNRVLLLLAAAAAIVSLLAGGPASAEDTIKIGDINSYSRFAAFAVPYRNAMVLAIEEINGKGGVLGRKLELVWRDDNVNTGDATRAADELVSREKVDVLTGTLFSNVGVAVADFANQKKIPFIAAMPLTDAMTMANGNKYTFRLKANTYMLVSMLVDQIKASGKKRWAIVAPNYEYGQSAAASFKRLIKEAIPDAEIVAEQYPALGKIDAGATASAIAQAKPDAIFCALFSSDLVQFYREGGTRGLFDDRIVISPINGEPEWLLPMKDEVPVDWIVTGYPWDQISDPAHKAFVAAYTEKFKDSPRFSSLIGYTEVYMLRDALTKAGSTNAEAVVATLPGMTFDTVIGKITIRAVDHQATFGTWVGKIALKNGHGALLDFHYADGEHYLIPEAEARAARPY
jgi:branched-chain amino acid transport system substrate-binding protein